MKKNLLAIALCGILAASFAIPVSAAEISGGTSQNSVQEQQEALPDSVLYYGQVKEIVKNEEGQIIQLRMDSERYGEYTFNISEETAWIDSGNQKAADPTAVKEGDGLYVFHSPMATYSLPPQSTAFAVVSNIPMDVGCAQYYEVESVFKKNGKLQIQTNNGGLTLLESENTEFSYYGSDKKVSAEDLRIGGHIMAWTSVQTTSYPAQAPVLHIMILPPVSGEPLTQEVLNQLLGKKDASSQSDATMTREQLVTALWKSQGSPRLMGYTGLSTTKDVGEISRSAQSAMAWAHQKGLISGTYLEPQKTATVGDAKEMLKILQEIK